MREYFRFTSSLSQKSTNRSVKNSKSENAEFSIGGTVPYCRSHFHISASSYTISRRCNGILTSLENMLGNYEIVGSCRQRFDKNCAANFIVSLFSSWIKLIFIKCSFSLWLQPGPSLAHFRKYHFVKTIIKSVNSRHINLYFIHVNLICNLYILHFTLNIHVLQLQKHIIT